MDVIFYIILDTEVNTDKERRRQNRKSNMLYEYSESSFYLNTFSFHIISFPLFLFSLSEIRVSERLARARLMRHSDARASSSRSQREDL